MKKQECGLSEKQATRKPAGPPDTHTPDPQFTLKHTEKKTAGLPLHLSLNFSLRLAPPLSPRHDLPCAIAPVSTHTHTHTDYCFLLFFWGTSRKTKCYPHISCLFSVISPPLMGFLTSPALSFCFCFPRPLFSLSPLFSTLICSYKSTSLLLYIVASLSSPLLPPLPPPCLTFLPPLHPFFLASSFSPFDLVVFLPSHILLFYLFFVFTSSFRNSHPFGIPLPAIFRPLYLLFISFSFHFLLFPSVFVFLQFFEISFTASSFHPYLLLPPHSQCLADLLMVIPTVGRIYFLRPSGNCWVPIPNVWVT